MEIVINKFLFNNYFNILGVLHSGYDNRETIRSEYEVLCEDKPCSLKYLVSKKIRDRLREVEKANRKKYATKVQNAMSNLERLFMPMCRKVYQS